MSAPLDPGPAGPGPTGPAGPGPSGPAGPNGPQPSGPPFAGTHPTPDQLPSPPPPTPSELLGVIDAQLVALIALAYFGPAEQGTAAAAEQACAAEVLLFRLRMSRQAVRDLRAAYDVPAGGRARDGRAVGADGAATGFPSEGGRAGGFSLAPGAVSGPFSLPPTLPPWVEPRRRALLPVLSDDAPRPGHPNPPTGPPTPYPPPSGRCARGWPRPSRQVPPQP